MPATSPEAIKRKRENEKRRRAAKQPVVLLRPVDNVRRRLMMPKIPADLPKSVLRKMIEEAFANTARGCDAQSD